MTFYYDEDEDALTENHPDEWFERTENGEWVFDVSDVSKRQNVAMAIELMNEAHGEEEN